MVENKLLDDEDDLRGVFAWTYDKGRYKTCIWLATLTNKVTYDPKGYDDGLDDETYYGTYYGTYYDSDEEIDFDKPMFYPVLNDYL